MTEEIQPTICVDTREPEGGGWEPYFSVPTIRQKLDSGDYSLLGCEEWICYERKTMGDLIGCLSHSRERFIDELRRAQRIPEFYVIVESSYQSLLRGDYRSQMNPRAAWESVIAMQGRFKVPFLFAQTPEIAAKLCESILVRWYTERVKALNACRRAMKRLTIPVAVGEQL
jgi:ERCC4-type nuclease